MVAEQTVDPESGARIETTQEQRPHTFIRLYDGRQLVGDMELDNHPDHMMVLGGSWLRPQAWGPRGHFAVREHFLSVQRRLIGEAVRVAQSRRCSLAAMAADERLLTVLGEHGFTASEHRVLRLPAPAGPGAS